MSESHFPSLNSSGLGSSSACARRVARSAAARHMRILRSCMMHVPIRGRTRLGYTVPRAPGGSKVLVSSPAEDLRPVSEVEAGVNFRPAGGVRGQVAGPLPGGQPGTGTMKAREGAATLSLHPEAPDTRFTSPGQIGYQAINGLDEVV